MFDEFPVQPAFLEKYWYAYLIFTHMESSLKFKTARKFGAEYQKSELEVFPRTVTVPGEVETILPLSNTLLDFNYTKEKCSFQRMFPRVLIENVKCSLKGNAIFQ